MSRPNPVTQWINIQFQPVEKSRASVRLALAIHARSIVEAERDDDRSRVAERILAAIATQEELWSAIDDFEDFDIAALERFESGEWTLLSAWEALGRTRSEIGLAERRKV
jgi:hypothetical protein